MHIAISPGQWQSWTAVSPLPAWHSRRVSKRENLRIKDPFFSILDVSKTVYTDEAKAKHSFKRQLHTTHVGVVGWEPLCVPLALGLS